MCVCIYTHLLETLQFLRMLHQSRRNPKLSLWWKATWAKAPSCTLCAPYKVLPVWAGTVPETAPDSIALAAQPAHVAHLDSRCAHRSYPSLRCAWWRIALWSWRAQHRWASAVAAPCRHRSARVQRKPAAGLWDTHLCLREKFINKHISLVPYSISAFARLTRIGRTLIASENTNALGAVASSCIANGGLSQLTSCSRIQTNLLGHFKHTAHTKLLNDFSIRFLVIINF